MAYTKQTWADLPSKTTPINAERLTHIEDGIFNAAQTADTAASTAGTAAANVGIVSGKVETLTERVNGLDTAVSNKVDKVAGKDLSTNDYTNTDKAKVDALGTASTKNSTSVVTQSTDLVESGAVKDIVGWGNKNKIRYPYVNTTKSSNNVTFTDNGDGSVTISTPSGSPASAQTSFTLNSYYMEGAEAIQNDLLNSGDLLISGGLSDDVFMYFYHPYETGGSIENRSGDNEFTFTRENGDWNVSIIVANGVDLSTPVTVKPMIRKKGTSATFEPYHASVEETLRDAEVIEGKNLLDWSKESQTINGITFTVNEDKSITANGTTTAGAAFILINSNSVYNREILGKSLKFTGCPQGGSESTYNLYLSTWGTTSAVTDYGSGAEINIPSSINGFRVDVAIKPNQTVSNLVFKPMLSLDGGEYEPYYIPLKDIVLNKCDNSVIGTVEDGATASQAYAVGSHAIRNGAFITWKNAKAQGETINDASDYTSGDVANSLIKEATFSGTTSDIGGLLISTSNTRHILSAEVQGYVIDIYKRSEGYGAIVKTIQTGERVVNTAVSGKYYYVEY